jgi:hypothetical protein
MSAQYYSYQGECENVGQFRNRAENETNLEHTTWRLIHYAQCELLTPAFDLENYWDVFAPELNPGPFPLTSEYRALEIATQTAIDLLVAVPVEPDPIGRAIGDAPTTCFNLNKPSDAEGKFDLAVQTARYWLNDCGPYFENLERATENLKKQICIFEPLLREFWEVRESKGASICEVAGSTVEEHQTYLDERREVFDIQKNLEIPKSLYYLGGAILFFTAVGAFRK